jgi:hypothetical protein
VIGPEGAQLEGMTAGLIVNAPLTPEGFKDSTTVGPNGTFSLEYSSCRYSFLVHIDGNGLRGTSHWLSCGVSETQSVDVVVTVFE